MTLKLTLALVMAFITAVIVGKFYVPWLKKKKAGQEIKENGPTWHMSKSGTPTMGGVIFISACTLVCLTVGFESMRSGDFTHIFVVVFDFQNTFPNRKSYFENVVGELLFHVAVTYFAVIVFLFKISQRFGG